MIQKSKLLFAIIHFQIVNTEWGAFSNGLPLTEFNREMDAESINPGEQVSLEFFNALHGNNFMSLLWKHIQSVKNITADF